MRKVLISVGTRPNIIKITQFKKHAAAHGLEVKILHTGQHYDHKMAQVFYDQFEVQPDFRQDLKPGTVLEQITQMMHNVTRILAEYKPDILLTPGDVNSTFAAAYAAYQAKIPVGHIESGLRSNDLTMPEEINRILTDDITDAYFITEKSGMENLKALGKQDHALHFVGNTMIDTLVAYEPSIDKSKILEDNDLSEGDFVLFTFHRPGNVDEVEPLNQLVDLLLSIAKGNRVVFPVHPRTRKMLEQNALMPSLRSNANITLLEPLDYFSFQKLVKHAKLVITDSGGIQEETTFRQVPCLTVRPNTERPSTVEIGSNTLLDFDVPLIMRHADEILAGKTKDCRVPDLWDGHSTERILQVIQAM